MDRVHIIHGGSCRCTGPIGYVDIIHLEMSIEYIHVDRDVTIHVDAYTMSIHMDWYKMRTGSILNIQLKRIYI